MASVPGTPVIQPRPTATNQTLEFWWNPPVSDGGSPITSYILTDGTNTFNLDSNARYYRAQGLANGTIYPFTISASNAIGAGAPVAFRAVQPGLKPDPPINLTYSSINTSNTDYLITWTNPANVGQATLNRVFLQAYPVDGNGTPITTSTNLIVKRTMFGGAAGETQSRIVPLISGYNYKVLVQTINDPGYSLPTAYTSTITLVSTVITAFSPSSLAGMRIWLDANDTSTITRSGASSTITTWSDKSGANNNATPGGTSPTYVPASNAVSFGGAGYMTTNYLASYSNETAFLVFNPANITGFQQLFASQPGGRQVFFGTSPNGSLYVKNTMGGAVIQPPSYAISATRALLTYFNNGVSTILSINGSNVAQGATISYTAGSTLLGTYYSGSAFGDYFNGQMFEFNGYSTSLTALSRQTTEGYLAWKWGLSTLLPTYHPFYTRAPLSSDSNLDFSPSSITNMTLWIDAADTTTLTITGVSTVTAVRDKSGYSNNTSSVNGTVITSSLNGVQSIFLNSTNLIGTLSTFSGRNFHFLGVSRVTNNSKNGRMLSFSRPGVDDWNQSDTFNFYQNGGAGLSRASATWTTGASFDTPYVFNISQNSNTVLATLNSQNTSTFTNGSTSLTNVNRWAIGVNAGNPSDTGSQFVGHIGEVLFYQSTLNFQNQLQAEGYLAWKWGIQSRLPSTHLYFFRPPTRKDTFTSFSPSSVSGLKLWIDAQDSNCFTLSGGSNVTQVIDKSSNGYVFSNATGFTYNVTKFNSTYPSFYNATISGGPNLGSNTQITMNQPITAFYVGSKNTTNVGVVYDGALSVNRVILYGVDVHFYAGADVTPSPAANYLLSNSMISGYYSTTGSQIFWNGSTIASGSVGTDFMSTLLLANRYSLDQSWDGHICEILLYNGALSLRDRQSIEGYLAWKWGIQNNFAQNTHPFRYGSTISLGPISTVNTL